MEDAEVRDNLGPFLWAAAANERGEEVLVVLLNLGLEGNRKLTKKQNQLLSHKKISTIAV